ncbi:MAG: serine hydrolase [Candidatus Aminicenantes bacterium]|nr:MAG: serine hydrolase [Candidatus Aminicenantes bacterium]
MRKKIKFCLAAFFILHLSFIASAQEGTQEDPFKGFPELVEDLISEWQIPGMAIGVVRDGEIIYMEGFGFRDLENKLPVTTKTVFGIGSISKSFTSMSVALLVDEAKLKWDTPVISYLPDFKLYDDYATLHATPRDLLCHRTGMADHQLMTYGSPFSREEVYMLLRYLEPNLGFRDRFQYNNLMYLTAGYLVGRVSDGTWEDFIRKRILKPLEMDATNFSLEIKDADDHSLPYIFSGGEITTLPFRRRDASGPSGGLNSNIEDMLKWLKLHLDQGKVGEKQLISEKSLIEILTPQMPVNYTPGSAIGPVTDYGFGWNIQPYEGHHLNHVGGWIEGFVTWISFMPVENIGVAVLCNMSDCQLPLFINYVIYSRLLGLEKFDWDKYLKSNKPRYLSRSYNSRRKPRSNPNRPSSPPEVLEGIYDHPAFGRIIIAHENGNLYAVFHGEKMTLNHMRDNVFLTEHLLDGFNRKRISFVADDQGKVGKLEMRLQQGVKDIVFLRQ